MTYPRTQNGGPGFEHHVFHHLVGREKKQEKGNEEEGTERRWREREEGTGGKDAIQGRKVAESLERGVGESRDSKM